MNQKKKPMLLQLPEWSFSTLAKVDMAKNAICKFKFVKAEDLTISNINIEQRCICELERWRFLPPTLTSANFHWSAMLTYKHGQRYPNYPNSKIVPIVDGQSV